jgi:2-oxoglutarate ferredoxin oxidoreductase subunit alpha
MTSSSSPGISLKSEGISYIAGCDLPCVIVNVQRGGPGLGGIQPSQADYYQATRGVGHGDMRLLVLAPSSVQEMASLTAEAFDIADTYRMPAMILADGALGQMMEPVDFSAFPKREVPEKPWATVGHKNARKKNIVNSLFIDPVELENSVMERYQRYAMVEENEVKYEEYMTDDADIVIVAYGITARIAKSAISELRKAGIKVGLLRPITLWPFPKAALNALADRVKAFVSVEMSMGQMVDDVRLAVNGKAPVHFYGRTGGMIPTVEDVAAEITKLSQSL